MDGMADPSYTMWRTWRSEAVAKRRVRRRYYFDDGCHGYCSPYVLPGLTVVFLVLGLCFLIAGFATQYWIYYDEGTEGANTHKEIYFGLWTQCAKIGVAATSCTGVTSLTIPEWFKAVEALAVISLVGIVLILGLLTYWLCSYHRNIYLKIFLIVTAFITFLLIICSAIVFRVKGDEYIKSVLTANNAATQDFTFSWSFYLFAISCGFVFLAGCFLMCIPGYGRHSEVYGDRIAIKANQPGYSTPPMAPRGPPMAPLQYPGSSSRPLSVQGYGTRGYMKGGYSDSSGYPGLMRPGDYRSFQHGYRAY